MVTVADSTQPVSPMASPDRAVTWMPSPLGAVAVSEDPLTRALVTAPVVSLKTFAPAPLTETAVSSLVVSVNLTATAVPVTGVDEVALTTTPFPLAVDCSTQACTSS